MVVKMKFFLPLPNNRRLASESTTVSDNKIAYIFQNMAVNRFIDDPADSEFWCGDTVALLILHVDT